MFFAKQTNGSESSSESVVKSNLNVTKFRRLMKFPLVYPQLQTKKCQIYTLIDGVLKKGVIVSIHCVIPGAINANLQADSNWLKIEDYTDPVLKRQVTAGSKEVIICAKYEEKSSYDGLVKYTVQ